jgi:phosphotransferase system HPr (HPr) family protein
MAISNIVNQFQSRVELQFGDKTANAASILELMSMGAGQGAELQLSACGPDAERVLDALAFLFENNFGLPLED